MRNELARRGRQMAIGAAAALYHLVFRLARHVAVPPAPELTPDPPVLPDALTIAIAVEAARRASWPR
ncbi:MAG: hypothetical protein ABI847_19990 [Anaerolineales bacterium]